MTTDPQQTQLISDQELQAQLEKAVEIHLNQIRAWTRLPTERVDWALEAILEELGTACLALRRLRGEADLPF